MQDQASIGEKEAIRGIMREMEKMYRGEPTGHDYFHILRVYNLAREIRNADTREANQTVVELASLLHEIDDWKIDASPAVKTTVRGVLSKFGFGEEIVEKVDQIVSELSYKGAKVATPMSSIEGEIVQDADRLDSLGAIGIARTFAYGGKVGRPLYDPLLKPTQHHSFEEYKADKSHSLNHFYEKLFLLQERLNTEAAKKIGRKRTQYMHDFVERFLAEWHGKD